MAYGDSFRVKSERSNFRDAAYSDWHRQLGYNCPHQDADIILGKNSMAEGTWIESDSFMPVALIDMKTQHCKIDLDNNSIRLQRNVANKLEVPFFVIKNEADCKWFEIYSTNTYAYDFLAKFNLKPGCKLSEAAYAHFLYALRNRQCPQDVIDRLKANRVSEN